MLLAQQMSDPRTAWAPIVLMIIISIIFATGSMVASMLVGPSRKGAVKGSTYESGMVPIGDTHKRFNVRFFVVAMIFLVFDVEIVFFYPWATIFAPYVKAGQGALLLIEMGIFVGLLVLAYIYAWGKGVFRWD